MRLLDNATGEIFEAVINPASNPPSLLRKDLFEIISIGDTFGLTPRYSYLEMSSSEKTTFNKLGLVVFDDLLGSPS